MDYSDYFVIDLHLQNSIKESSMCEDCKFYKDGWWELLMVEMPADYKCKADDEPKETE